MRASGSGVEHLLPKQRVAGSNPVSRSIKNQPFQSTEWLIFFALVSVSLMYQKREVLKHEGLFQAKIGRIPIN